MKLTDLDPHWIGIAASQLGEIGPSLRFGVTCLCPHCTKRAIGFLFKPFIDPFNYAERISWVLPGAPNPNTGECKEPNWWQRTGETFDTLSITPSINVEGHWHGFISNGEVT